MNIKMIGAAILAGAMVAGCGAKDGEGEKAKADEAVLAVNGEKLMRSEIDTDIEKLLKAQGDKVPAEQRDYFKQMVQNQIAQSFIVEKVLVAKAKAEGYTVTDADRKERGEQFLKAMAKQPNAPKSVEEYFKSFPLGEARARTEFENGILIDKMIKAAQAKAPAAANDEKVKKIIEDAKANNAKAATADADAKKKIADLKAQLAKVAEKDLPAKFAELAKANSDCPSKDKGGDLGEFTHGQMVKEFDEVAFKLPVNKVSDPVKTQFGYHLVMTTKKIPAVEAKDGKPAEPEKVQASHILVKVPEVQPVPKAEEVTKFLKQQDDRKFVQEFIMGLVKKAKIEAFADDFKQFVPPSEEKKPAPKPVAKPAKKAVESQAVKLEKKVESAKKDADNAVKQAPVSKPISKPTPAPVEKPAAK